ncbi:MAG: hypothetical protein KGN02_06035 [bacterium]|nr:hypothetical protein [bacterium]
MAALKRSNVVATFALVAALVLVFSIAQIVAHRPINGDEAYNMQIAKSLATDFCYCTRYHPIRVFPVEESSNGVMQYVAATFFATLKRPDLVKLGTVIAAMLLLCAAVFALDAWLVLLTAALFVLWPVFTYVAVSVYGEMWAAAFVVLGVVALRRCDLAAPLALLVRSRAMLLAILCFGLAIESKLIAVIAVLPIVWAELYGRLDALPTRNRIARATAVTAAVGGGTFAVLFSLIAFSVLHSTRSFSIGTAATTFVGFIGDMILQGRGQAAPLLSGAVTFFQTFTSAGVLVLIAAAFALLIYVNRGYVLFAAVTLAWCLHYGGNERHDFISLFVALMLAGEAAHRLLVRESRARTIAFARLASLTSAVLVLVVVGIALLARDTVDAPAAVQRFAHVHRLIQVADGRYHYTPALVAALRRYRYVATSGWWQFPELSLRENLEFYDRTNPANADLPRDQVVLFIDRENHLAPSTTVQANCGPIVYTEGPLVICKPNPRVPLAYQPPAGS